MAMSGDRFGSDRRRRSRIDRVGADPPRASGLQSLVRPDRSSATAALGLMTKSRAFPGDSAWRRVRRRSNIRA